MMMVSVVAKIEYGEGEVYEGEWDGDGRRHGKGCLTFSDGSKYKGQFKAGLFHVSEYSGFSPSPEKASLWSFFS